MAINPAQTCAPTAPPKEACPPRKLGSGSTAFDAILNSFHDADSGSPAASQRVAAELLRIQMMQSTLSIAGDAPDGGAPALQSLLTGLAGGSGLPRGTLPGGTEVSRHPVVGEAPMPQQAPSSETDQIEQTAEQYLGTPYRFGGETASGIDCSSFVQQVFRENHIELPRTAREQINVGSEVPTSELRKGDLVFFQTYASYPSHVGIYLGDGKMIHASSGKGEVTISDMNSDYYRPRYLGAKRVV